MHPFCTPPRQSRGLLSLCLLALLHTLPGATAVAAAENWWGVNIYGLSWHPDRSTARDEDLDNEVNPGLGLRYDFSPANSRWLTFAEAGVFRDSGREWAKMAGVGAQYRLTRRLSAGGALAAFYSDTYNKGDPFIAPVPLVSWDFGPLILNATYFPKVSDFNKVAAFAVYVTVPLGRERP